MASQRVILGDSLDVIRTFDAQSFDTVLADPPYGIGYRYNPGPQVVNQPHATGTKIENDERPFIWWLYDAFRVTKLGGCLVCFCAWKTQDDFRRAIEIAGWKVRSQVVWDKRGGGMGDLKRAFTPTHEVIWFATKGDAFRFPDKRPPSVMRYTKLSKCENHPHEKPLPLLEALLTATTKPGGSVLDPFAGSASAGVAAKNVDLDYTGIELDPTWFEVAERRLAA